MKYGRDEEDWDLLTQEGLDFLIERARLGRETTYTEINTVLARRTGLRGFDFDEQSERVAMGYLLGLIVDASLPRLGFMISSLVNYLDENNAGSGFYALAQLRGLLRRGASSNEKDEFWIDQMNAAYVYYASAR